MYDSAFSQWCGADLKCEDKIDRIKEELADIIIYSILLAEAYNLDIEDIVVAKLEKNNQRYPISKSYGSSAKYTEIHHEE